MFESVWTLGYRGTYLAKRKKTKFAVACRLLSICTKLYLSERGFLWTAELCPSSFAAGYQAS
uniref:Uncharacterized protein n=1 Tax=Anguilla anguilla TaxID=7936 RepID=A0A0E9VRS3_ANGAN